MCLCDLLLGTLGCVTLIVLASFPLADPWVSCCCSLLTAGPAREESKEDVLATSQFEGLDDDVRFDASPLPFVQWRTYCGGVRVRVRVCVCRQHLARWFSSGESGSEADGTARVRLGEALFLSSVAARCVFLAAEWLLAICGSLVQLAVLTSASRARASSKGAHPSSEDSCLILTPFDCFQAARD